MDSGDPYDHTSYSMCTRPLNLEHLARYAFRSREFAYASLVCKAVARLNELGKDNTLFCICFEGISKSLNRFPSVLKCMVVLP